MAGNESWAVLREETLDRIGELVGTTFPRSQWRLVLDKGAEALDLESKGEEKTAATAVQTGLHTMLELEDAYYRTKQNEWSASVVLVFSCLNRKISAEIQKTPFFAPDAAHITIKALIIPGDRTKEGTLVKGVTALWFAMLRMIRANPNSIHQIDCWKWEELLAGAYKQDGWEVVLTPKRGDHGIDVIAERKGWGQLRFLLLDQMKAYKPRHLIGPDEIREMKGVLLDHPEASKGLITTTADFTTGEIEAAANLAPRLELRPHDKVLEWLASVAVENMQANFIDKIAKE